jgi:hypothetical protein
LILTLNEIDFAHEKIILPVRSSVRVISARALTAKQINEARKKRGKPPVPAEAEVEESSLSLGDLRRIAAQVA